MKNFKETKIRIENKDIEELKRYFEKQVLAIPELQRNFVWNANRMRDLADSIYKGYAIGSLVIWDAPKRREIQFKHFGGVLPPYKAEANSRINYVIDGQQRLSALASFLHPGGKNFDNDRGQHIKSYNICFATKKSDDNLNFAYFKNGPDNKKFFSICDILSNDFGEKFRHLRTSKVYKRLLYCRERFFDYVFCFVYVHGDLDEENLRETFIRLNTRGLSLSAVDRAYAYASRVHLREFVHRIKERLGALKAVSDKPIHEVLYVINRVDNDSRINSKSIDTFFKQLNNDERKRKHFEREWRRVAHAVEYTEHFLKGRGVLSIDYLPSISMIAALSTFYYYKRGESLSGYQAKMLNKWFWYAALSSRYSGRGYHHYMSSDCAKMKLLAKGKKIEFDDFRKKIDGSDLINTVYYLKNSSVTRIFYCLLALQKPKEFLYNGNREIDLKTPTILERKQNHHIFPQNLMKKLLSHKKYHSIINICFLPQDRNASFSDDPPYNYLNSRDIDKENLDKILKSHLVPIMVKRKELNLKSAFNKFIEQRKKMIVNKFEKEANFKIFE